MWVLIIGHKLYIEDNNIKTTECFKIKIFIMAYQFNILKLIKIKKLFIKFLFLNKKHYSDERLWNKQILIVLTH